MRVSLSSRTAATQSALTYPLAAESKDRQRPAGESILKARKLLLTPGSMTTETPPTIARRTRPDAMSCRAWCAATSEDEQAVSTVIEGPRKSKQKETRLENMLWEQPVFS